MDKLYDPKFKIQPRTFQLSERVQNKYFGNKAHPTYQIPTQNSIGGVRHDS